MVPVFTSAHAGVAHSTKARVRSTTASAVGRGGRRRDSENPPPHEPSLNRQPHRTHRFLRPKGTRLKARGHARAHEPRLQHLSEHTLCNLENHCFFLSTATESPTAGRRRRSEAVPLAVKRPSPTSPRWPSRHRAAHLPAIRPRRVAPGREAGAGRDGRRAARRARAPRGDGRPLPHASGDAPGACCARLLRKKSRSCRAASPASTPDLNMKEWLSLSSRLRS